LFHQTHDLCSPLAIFVSFLFRHPDECGLSQHLVLAVAQFCDLRHDALLLKQGFRRTGSHDYDTSADLETAFAMKVDGVKIPPAYRVFLIVTHAGAL
jgi:hypothetical protein